MEKKPYGTWLTDAVPSRCNNNNYFQSCPTNTRTHVIGLLYMWSLLLLLSLLFIVRTKDVRVRVRVLWVCTPSPFHLCVFFKRNFLYIFTVHPGRKHGHYVCVFSFVTLFFIQFCFAVSLSSLINGLRRRKRSFFKRSTGFIGWNERAKLKNTHLCIILPQYAVCLSIVMRKHIYFFFYLTYFYIYIYIFTNN